MPLQQRTDRKKMPLHQDVLPMEEEVREASGNGSVRPEGLDWSELL